MLSSVMSDPLDQVEGIIRNSTILTEPEANNCFTIITRVIIVEEKETHSSNCFFCRRTV